MNNDQVQHQTDSEESVQEDKEKPKELHPIAKLARNFLGKVSEFEDAAFIAVRAIAEHIDKRKDELKDSLQKYVVEEDETRFAIEFPSDQHELSKVRTILREFEKLNYNSMHRVVIQNMFTGLFSEFDAYTGNLIRAIYKQQPNLFKDIKREIAISDILEYESLDAIKQAILDKEVDTFRRDSYVEQFCAFERKFDIKLKKFKEWIVFVEMGQRRNLITHNDGCVTTQYLKICAQEGIKYKNGKPPEIGKRLSIGPNYFYLSCITISIVAFMLAYTLWRKVIPEDAEELKDQLNLAIYDLLADSKWLLASRLGEFSLSEPMRKGIDDLSLRMRVINYAIALKNCKREDEMHKVLQSYDWTACIKDFKIAIAVLKDDFDTASNCMREIGKSSELIRQSAYHEWPLFFTFRNSEKFLCAYKDIYDVPFDPATDGQMKSEISQQREEGDALLSVPVNSVLAPPSSAVEA